MTKKTVSWLSGAGLLLAACIWGFAFVVVKDALDFINAFYMMAFRFSIASVVLCIVFFRKIIRTTKRDLLRSAVLGFFLFIAYTTQTVGCDYTTAGKNAFLTTLYVILVPFLSWLFYKKMPAFRVFVAAFMSFVGIALLALGSGDSLLAINLGDALTLVCGVFYALHILYMKKCSDDNSDVVLLTCLQLFFCAVFSWGCVFFVGGSFPSNIGNARVIISVLYLGLFSTLLCYVLQNVALKFLSPPIVSLLMSFESVFGITFGVMFLQEPFTIRMCIGCVLIFAAVLLAEIKVTTA